MKNTSAGSSAVESPSSVLAGLVDELAARAQAGEAVDLEAVLRKHPKHADELRQLWPALAALHDLSRSGERQLSGVAPLQGGVAGVETGVLGDFRIVREVGRGGMGVVYEAVQLSLNRRVALKVLPFAATMDPRHLQRFHNEAQAAASLHHTHIVPVYAVGCERGVHSYAMQLIDGQTLGCMIQQSRRQSGRQAPAAPRPSVAEKAGGPEPADAATPPLAAASTEPATQTPAYFRTVAQLGEQAAEALEYAHQLGVVHRDIKPANLMVDARGKLWVTDFGLAQVQSDTRLTLTGDLAGTLRYMSPEQALAQRVAVDHRTDVYSLGATLYELLTLEPVSAGTDRQELLRQIAFAEPKPPRRLSKRVPAELETIVLKALEKNPNERYATAQDLADDLRRWLEDKPIRARRPSVAQRARKWARRHQGGVLAAAVVSFVAAAGLGVSAVLIWNAKTEAQENYESAQKATTEEAKQRRRADENFRRSVEEFTEMLKVAMDGEVPGPPELDRVRQAQAKRVIEHLQAQLAENRPDPEGRLLTGLAYRALGQAHVALGKYAQAGDLFARALVAFEELAADFPDDARYQKYIGLARQDMRDRVIWVTGSGGHDLMSAGKYAEAVQVYRDTLIFFEKYRPLMEELGPCKAWMWRALLVHGLARALRASGQSGEAEEYCTLAVDTDAKLLADCSNNVYVPWSRLEQAGAYTLRGLCRTDVGRTAEAEADFRQAIALLDALAPKDRLLLVTDATNQPLAHHALGNLLWAAARQEEASEVYRRAEKGWREEPRNMRSNSCLAWLLATCPDPQVRKPAEAVELAKEATTFPPAPDTRPLQALGAAQYRAGDTKAALATLEKSRQLDDGGDGVDFFFLAMACWEQGDKDQARRWHDKGVEWMAKARPHDPELLCLGAEAAALLGIKNPPTAKAKEESPRKE
jgi:serine/threonine protein kinase